MGPFLRDIGIKINTAPRESALPPPFKLAHDQAPDLPAASFSVESGSRAVASTAVITQMHFSHELGSAWPIFVQSGD